MMKLRNKKTGEVHEITQAIFLPCTMNKKFAIYSESEGHNYTYNSLAELNEEWEDYEEPKEYWWIDTGSIPMVRKSNNPILSTAEDIDKEIGNYFETREEAEKAVEKLKAWKRLKDKGFRFILDGETEMPMFIYSGANGEKCITNAGESRRCRDDIKLLFGGEG